MITRVRIENFRSIESLEFYPTALCALVGENSVGKSNILDAIWTVLGKEWHRVTDFSETDFLDHDPTKDILIELEFDPPPEHEGFRYEDPTEVPVLRFELTRYKRATGDRRPGDLRLDAKPVTRDGESINVLNRAPRKGEAHQYRPLTNISRDIKRQVPLIYVKTDRRLADQLPHTRYSLLRRLLEDVAEGLDDRTIEDGGEERPVVDVFSERLESALEVLRVPEFLELEDLLRTRALENLGLDPAEDRDQFDLRFGLFEPMDFFKAIKLMVSEGEREFEAEQLGHAAQNALVIAIFQAYEALRKSGAVFLIEEPEMYLHPHRCRFFYETLRRLSATNQIIYTTHSPHFVSVPEFEEVRIVYRDSRNRTAVRASSLEADEALREKLRKEMDPERSELFFASHVILVEGDTEKLAFPEWARRLGVDLDRLGISVVEVGGKRNLPAFADIVASFGIPLTIVFDTDSSEFRDRREEEGEFNAALRARQSDRVNVIELDPKYEAVYREQIGDAEYQRVCEAYPGVTKAVRGRLIAADESAPVPDFMERVLRPYIELHARRLADAGDEAAPAGPGPHTINDDP